MLTNTHVQQMLNYFLIDSSNPNKQQAYLQFDQLSLTAQDASMLATLLNVQLLQIYKLKPELERYSFYAANKAIRLQPGNYLTHNLAPIFFKFRPVCEELQKNILQNTIPATPSINPLHHVGSQLRQQAALPGLSMTAFQKLVRLAMNKKVLNSRSLSGKTALHEAILAGEFEKALILISAGALIDDQARQFALQLGNIPLPLAKLLGQPELAGPGLSVSPTSHKLH